MLSSALSSLFLGDKSDRQRGDSPAEELFRRYSIDTAKKYGEGGYGATFPAVDHVTKEALAVKVIDTRRMKVESIVRECDFLTSLSHPNVIAIKAHGPGRKSAGQDHLYYIFMELAGGGELFDQVIDRGANTMPEEVARQFMLQLVAGVLHCHADGIAHRDLKLENVLLTKEGVVKVIDFGLSHRYGRQPDGSLNTDQPLSDVCGSKSYAAPEVLARRGYNGFAADVWSIGVSLFAMLSGFFPLDEASSNDWRCPKLQTAQLAGRSTTAVVFGWYKRPYAHLSLSVISLLDAMLAIDPAKRLSLEQVLLHPWMLPTPEEVDALQLPPALLPLPAAPRKTILVKPDLRHPAAPAAPAEPHPSSEAALAHVSSLPTDQGTYNARNLIDFDNDGPAFRCCLPTMPPSAYDIDPEDDRPLHRALDLNGSEVGSEIDSEIGTEVAPRPLPAIIRQRAFSRWPEP
mmetsp:Transcript_4617/g.10015  ORF Transcript_4617/g.10015 Transcript_4617/m.10015 type:complete len:459 (-) Transcript_4617:240-1616(-)